MKEKNLSPGYKMALGGVFSALAVVSMLLSYIVPTATYACPALAGVMLIPLVIEVGRGWALCSYFAVSLLSFLIVADKEIALCFVAFFGFYPILKAVLEERLSKYICWAVKIAAFAVCMIAVFFVSILVLGVPRDSFTVFGFYLPWAFLAVGAVIFVVYDIALTRVIRAYVGVWRDKIFKRFK